MKFSNIIYNRINWIIFLIFLFNFIILFILIITLIVPLEDNPPIYHFPFMVYIEYALTLIFFLFLIAGVLLKKKESKFKERSDNWGFITILFEKIEWEEKITLWRKVIRGISLAAFIIITLCFLGIGFVAFQLLVSPMILLYLPFAFCMIVIWLSMGIKKENIRVVIVLFIIVGSFMGLVIGALIIAKDEKVLLLAISYQIIALILIGVRLVSCFRLKRKNRISKV